MQTTCRRVQPSSSCRLGLVYAHGTSHHRRPIVEALIEKAIGRRFLPNEFSTETQRGRRGRPVILERADRPLSSRPSKSEAARPKQPRPSERKSRHERALYVSYDTSLYLAKLPAYISAVRSFGVLLSKKCSSFLPAIITCGCCSRIPAAAGRRTKQDTRHAVCIFSSKPVPRANKNWLRAPFGAIL